LAPFEGNARDLGVKSRRIGDRRIRIAEILVAFGEDALDERGRYPWTELRRA
jgi:hypothetical protein